MSKAAGVALCIFVLCPCFGKELVYLTSGFQLEAQSHTEENQILVLRTASGTVEVPAAAVVRIEPVKDDPSLAETVTKTTDRAPEELLQNAAIAQGLPPELVRSVAQIESRFDPRAVSPKGAIGLMQLMPGTAAELGVNATRANENAQGGAKYLRSLLVQYRGDAVLALAAYNAGPQAVAKFRGVPPYSETRHYVERVLREYAREQKLQTKRAPVTAVSKPTSTD